MRELHYTRPWLYPKQLAAIFCPARYAIIEASTKVGKSAGCMIWITEQAMQQRPGRAVWWVAPVVSQARIMFDRLRLAIPRALYTAKETPSPTITLANGVTIWFKGADKPDTLYGEDVWAAVIDEAPRIKPESWYAVRTTLTATEGPIRIIGNVKGRKNWAYDLARKAEAGEPDWHYAKLTVLDAHAAIKPDGTRVVTQDAIDKAQRTFPTHVFRELYFAEPSDDGGNPFGLKAIERCVMDGLSAEPPVAFGVDLAKHVDYTVIIGLDRAGRVCYVDRFQTPWEITIGRILAAVGDTPTLVDSTGVGDPVLEALQIRGRPQQARITGFTFTSKSKQQIMEGLAVAIQRHEVRFPEGPIKLELDSFEYEIKPTSVAYSAPDGQHDDCVCALALAVEHARCPVEPFSAWNFA